MANYRNDTAPNVGAPYTGVAPVSTTSSGTIPQSLVLKSWAKKTWETGIKESYFSKFMGRDAKSIIHIKEELSRGRGTSINIPLLMPLTGAGVIEDNLLEGNEESLVYRDFDVPLSRIRHAVRLAGRFEEQKTQMHLREDARSALSEWLSWYVDSSIFAILTGTEPAFINGRTIKEPSPANAVFPFEIEEPSLNRVICGGDATVQSTFTGTVNGISAPDHFGVDLISKAKRLARADETTAIRPIRVDGRETYVMVIDQWQARDLKGEEKWIKAQELANIRGEKNPIFSGAIGIWDGVVIHECNRVPRTKNNKNVMVSHALFLGAQACVFAEGEAPRWVEKSFDYENQYGVSVGRMFGLKKSQFKFDGTNWTDFGVINVLTSSIED
ncbi:MAG: N4-gp56 family major capsid protein [Bacteroidales bacterium]|nr:N4-gp56 family major capsid protein [Bacteroidales bacterium]